MNATTAALQTFAAEMPAVGWDMFGRGWGNEFPIEATTRDALVALGHDAFGANLLMEEALMERRAGRQITVGAHREVGSYWQDGMSTDTDAKNRVLVNSAYAG